MISDLRQVGSLKALFPRVEGDPLHAVFLNTAGGLTGGDKMRIAARAQEGAHLVLSSQAAERAYRAPTGSQAISDVELDVAAGGRIDWLPQETILFEGAALSRRLTVRLSAGGTALLVEPIIFGRAAMGEVVHDLRFTDQWRVYCDGQLMFADAIRLIGDAAAQMQRLAIAAGAGALATLSLVGKQAAAFAGVDLPDNAAASLIADDLLLVRLLAEDGFTLRRDLIPVIEALSDAPLPRVWRL